jgi:hypothetical protein
VQSAGLDEGGEPAGARWCAGAVTGRPAQLQQPGRFFELAVCIGR